MSKPLLMRVVGCFGTGDRILMPEASVSDSSASGCRTDLILLVDTP